MGFSFIGTMEKAQAQNESIMLDTITFDQLPQAVSHILDGITEIKSICEELRENGSGKDTYMTVEELDAHAKRFSQTYRRGYGLWADKDMRGAMMEKTVLKRLLSKYAPLSVEMRDAIASDQAVLGENDSKRYIDNEENAIDIEKAQELASKFADFEIVDEKEEKKK